MGKAPATQASGQVAESSLGPSPAIEPTQHRGIGLLPCGFGDIVPNG